MAKGFDKLGSKVGKLGLSQDVATEVDHPWSS